MKTKRETIHIENEYNCRCFVSKESSYPVTVAFCGRYEGFLYPWEKAKDMKPRCKTCLKAVEAEKRRRG